MKMRKRLWLLLLLAALLCFGMAGSVLGADQRPRVYDMAGLLTESEKQRFEQRIGECQREYGLEVVVVTAEDARGKESQEYADDFYDEGDFGEDGILFLVDMDNREIAISTRGKAIRIFTDQRIEDMLDGVYEGASRGDYAAGVESFLSDTEKWSRAGIPGGQYNYDTETGDISPYRSIRWYEALMALGVSAFVAASACLSVKRRYAMEEDPRQTRNLNMAYRAEARFMYDDQTDRLVNKFVTTQVIPRSTSGGGHGGGHSSAGRSSTHTSSGGHTHGGGSRKF